MLVDRCLSSEYRRVDSLSSVSSALDSIIEDGYVAVFSGTEFVGVLTSRDLLSRRHQLAADCLTPKPALDADLEIEEAVLVMERSNHAALPVFDGDGEFIGCVEYAGLLRRLAGIEAARPRSEADLFLSLPGPADDRSEFSRRLFLSTRNPLQVMQSALRLLQDERGAMDRKVLVDAVLYSAKQIDDVINTLHRTYLEPAPRYAELAED